MIPPVHRPLLGLALLFPLAFYGQNNRAPQIPSMNDEAKSVARQILLHQFKQCGTSLYVYRWIDYDTHSDEANDGLYLPAGLKERPPHERQLFGETGVSVWLSEFSGLLENLVVIDRSSSLSRADRLNGIQWAGDVQVDSKVAAVRDRDWRNGEWGPWDTTWHPIGFRKERSFYINFIIRKWNGKWFTAPSLGIAETPVAEVLSTPQPVCADLPLR